MRKVVFGYFDADAADVVNRKPSLFTKNKGPSSSGSNAAAVRGRPK